MGEEWRLMVDLEADGALAGTAHGLVAELRDEIGLHKAEGHLVAYADSPVSARAVERRLRGELEKRGLAHIRPSIEHWDHEQQEWKDDSDTPTEEAESDQENDDRGDEDDAAETNGEATWTVTVSLEHHRDARRLADQLKSEGWRVSSSWHTLEISTRSRDDAESVVAELEMRAPGAETEILVGS